MKRILQTCAIAAVLAVSAAQASSYPTPPLPYQVLSTTQTIVVKMAGNKTTTAPTFAIAYADQQETLQSPGGAVGTFADSTTAVALAAPAQGVRNVASITICNLDTVSQTLSVYIATSGSPGTPTGGLLDTVVVPAHTTVVLGNTGAAQFTPITYPLTVPLGGTGNSSLTASSLLIGNGSSAITTAATLPAGNFPALTGNVTTSAGSLATTIANGVVTNAMLAGSIVASKLVGTDIATLGTITSGTWNGTIITSAFGGTGANNTATSGTILRGNGTNWVTSAVQFPNTAANNKVLVGNGTNWVESTPTFPNASATALKWTRSDGTNWIASSSTLAEGAVTTGKFLQTDGTNWVASPYTLPGSSGATAGKVLASDGTNYQALYPTRYSTVTGNKTLATSDLQQMWLVTCGSSTNATMTLPQANTVSAGACVWFKKSDTGTKAMVIQCNVADTIDGATSTNQPIIGSYFDGSGTLTSRTGQYAYYGLMCDGSTNWMVIDCGGDQVIQFTSGLGLTPGSFTTLNTISLTPGTWDISCNGAFAPNGATLATGNAALTGINVTTNSSTGLVMGDNEAEANFGQTGQPTTTVAVPSYIVQITSTTNFFQIVAANGTGTPQASGRISARRIK